jgi:hypothetical protein
MMTPQLKAEGVFKEILEQIVNVSFEEVWPMAGLTLALNISFPREKFFLPDIGCPGVTRAVLWVTVKLARVCQCHRSGSGYLPVSRLISLSLARIESPREAKQAIDAIESHL